MARPRMLVVAGPPGSVAFVIATGALAVGRGQLLAASVFAAIAVIGHLQPDGALAAQSWGTVLALVIVARLWSEGSLQ